MDYEVFILRPDGSLVQARSSLSMLLLNSGGNAFARWVNLAVYLLLLSVVWGFLFLGMRGVIAAIVFFGLTELLLRKFRGSEKTDHLELFLPHRKFCRNISLFEQHPLYGFALRTSSEIQGKILSDAADEVLNYTVHINDLGARATSETPADLAKPTVLVLGCSATFGLYLNDAQTFSWALQSKDRNRTYLNFGVPGASLYQQYLKLNEYLALYSPEIVILGYQPFLDQRNLPRLHLPRYRSIEMPYCAYIQKTFHRSKSRFLEFPPEKGFLLTGGSQSEMVALLSDVLNWMREPVIHTTYRYRKTTEYLLVQMRKRIEEVGAKFLVASLSSLNPHSAFLRNHAFNWCSVNFNVYGGRREEYLEWSLAPFDSHPNEKAHRAYADSIGDALTLLDEYGRCAPPEGMSEQEGRGLLNDLVYPLY